MSNNKPTIKGIFVKSHVKKVFKEKGGEGVAELERCFGKSVDFSIVDNILVSDEVKIIECALKIISKEPVSPDMISFEAGRLHFRNFSETPFGKIILSHPKKYLKKVLLGSKYIAEHVFKGINFDSLDQGQNKIKILMEGGEYPIDHFKGLFFEWIRFFGFTPEVEARETGPEKYEYVLKWTN